MLNNRRLRVHYRGKFSNFVNIEDGTNQGFVSGPTDFSAASSTLLERLRVRWQQKSTAKGVTRNFGMVADDLSACITGKKRDLKVCAEAFLKVVSDWAADYGFVISGKSEALFITDPHAHHPDLSSWDLKCGGVPVPIKGQGHIRILGYLIDAKLTFTAAVEHALQQHAMTLLTLLPVIHAFCPMDRKITYEAIAMSHIRRLAPILLCVGNDTKWDALNTALANAARVMFGLSRTARSVSCIVEAGMLDAKSLGIKSTIFLRQKLLAANLPGAMAISALRLLRRYDSGTPAAAPGCGVLVDRQPIRPADTLVESHVRCIAEPPLSDTERRRLARKTTDAKVKYGLKRTANARVREQIPVGETLIFCDGSVRRRTRRHPNAGGGAAAVHMIHGMVADFAARKAGARACSFTAEVHGMDAAIALLKYLEPSAGEVVHIVTDSQSLVLAIGKGIARQTDGRVAEIWKQLLELTTTYGCTVVIHFAYGHSNWAEADAADKHARAAATEGAQASSPEWWVDIARTEASGPITANLRELLQDSLRGKVLDKAPGCLPARWPKSEWNRNPQSRGAVSLLARMRTNACSTIGGHLIGAYNCPLCNSLTVRGGDGSTMSMVEHMFVCDNTRGLRRTHRIKGLQDLWNRPLKALRLAAAYMRAPE
jgi:ribonuclease HI